MLILGMRAVKISLKTSLKSPLTFQFRHASTFVVLQLYSDRPKFRQIINLDILYVEKKNLIGYLYQYKYFLNEKKSYYTIKFLAFNKER